jgi:hypothetical protein
MRLASGGSYLTAQNCDDTKLPDRRPRSNIGFLQAQGSSKAGARTIDELSGVMADCSARSAMTKLTLFEAAGYDLEWIAAPRRSATTVRSPLMFESWLGTES